VTDKPEMVWRTAAPETITFVVLYEQKQPRRDWRWLWLRRKKHNPLLAFREVEPVAMKEGDKWD
jgi:hypothetical protein